MFLKESTFRKFAEIFYQLTGIELKENKKYLIENRLSKFIGENKPYKTYEEFYKALLNDTSGRKKELFIQSLITNYTFFFREPIHFSFVRWYLRNYLEAQPYIRIWSNGCSTGEEPYSIAISALLEYPNLSRYDFKILATDVVVKYLEYAKEGKYPKSKLQSIDQKLLSTYFEEYKEFFMIKKNVKELIAFRLLNIISNYPFSREFDIVFLRNVLIYFSPKEKEKIIQMIYPHLKKNGYLIIGLSESLVGITHFLKPLKYSIYKKA